MSDAERFMEKFTAIWAAPDPDRFTELFHAEGKLLHPGMEQPISAEEIPDYIRGIKAALPDVSLAVERWLAGEDFVLIEWVMGGTLFGRDVRWAGADRFTLRGDRATDGVAYFDSLPLWSLVDRSMARESSLEEAVAALTPTS
ncbi:MAG: nuclear transport factor 2 family protein [Solirubrobacterales bacterium]